MMNRLAAVVLAAACIHEFAWQMVTPDLQGDLRAVTQWPLVASLCLGFAVAARDRFAIAAAVAVGIMSLTTAACSLAWLVHPFEVLPGEDQCSRHWGLPMLLVSALAACAAVAWWSPYHGKR